MVRLDSADCCTLTDINAYLAGASAPAYHPLSNSNAPVTLTMVTSDGGNSSAGGVQTDTDRATIILAPVNDAPVATGSMIQTREDVPVSGVVAATDADGDPLTYAIATGPRNGTAVIDASGRYLYSPNTDFSGDSFDISISDGQGSVTTVTIAVTVTPVNDAPVGSDATATAVEDQTLNGRLPVATDVDKQPDLRAWRQAAHGTVTVNPDGTYSYDADCRSACRAGADGSPFTVSDGQATSTYTVSITVTAVNDAPVSSGNLDLYRGGRNGYRPVAPTSDADGDPITLRARHAGVQQPCGHRYQRQLQLHAGTRLQQLRQFSASAYRMAPLPRSTWSMSPWGRSMIRRAVPTPRLQSPKTASPAGGCHSRRI